MNYNELRIMDKNLTLCRGAMIAKDFPKSIISMIVECEELIRKEIDKMINGVKS